ncbi:hypothetical protein F4810DRAFT_524493 [Camillea tinctor]|nr:hypothetical protein F4810DRAFT_524493 [Camillea tinctor]
MAPPIHLATRTGVPFTPSSDALDRHEYGITKNRKFASTGGGRAWSEDEEVYLLQTRLQKMPYKHIAAHLKKTELACRLHYHQLSHGSNRRKRTTSVSSGSSSTGHSPIMPATIPSPIRECSPRDPSPPGSSGSHDPSSPAYTTSMQLPSIMTSSSLSPRLPAILPKPASMTFTPVSAAPTLGYPTPLPDSARSLAPSPFPQPSPIGHAPTTLRLDCSSLPPPPSLAQVDVARLQAIYAAHRSSFWGAVAAEYGPGASPVVLEQAWKAYVQTPITPVTSPNERERDDKQHDKTRISAILGIDANPRSPKERELVRRMEEERIVSVGA